MAEPSYDTNTTAVSTLRTTSSPETPQIVTRAATIAIPGPASPPHPSESSALATDRLGPPPSPNSPSGYPIEQQATGQSPIGRNSPSSVDGRSRASSVRASSVLLEDHGITVYTATDRGYTAAEKMHNVGGSPGASSANGGDDDLGVLIDRQVLGKGTKRWLPIDKLFALVNRDSVHKELSRALSSRQLSQAELDDYTSKFGLDIEDYDQSTQKTIKMSRRCIFATLALSERVEDAPAFAESTIWDEDLPLEWQVESNELISRANHSKRMAVPEGWNYRIAVAFEYYQFYVLSPFFDLESPNDVPFHELDEGCVLPFVEDWHKERRQYGHHGTVWKVKIHHAHHNFHTEDGENPYFAIKELTSNDKGDFNFKNEVTAWAKSVGVAGHPHIIRLLATWHQNNSWYLLFGWADGNLRDYWKHNGQGSQHEEPKRRHEQVQWIGDQCLGIAQGLARIHRATSNDDDKTIDNYGIHGDVKPENILNFKDKEIEDGRLVICDFGFTRFHSRRSRSKAPAEGTSPTYRAPEYDATERNQSRIISRACDVWSLGCVYLEFITWYLMGFEAVEEIFTSHRISEDRGELIPSDKFFSVVTMDGRDTFGAIVKPCVYEWIRTLRGLPHCSQFCHDFLDVIENDLLVVDPKRRSDCYSLAKKLNAMCKETRNEQNGRLYCLKGCPRVTAPSSPSSGNIPEVFEYTEETKERMKQSTRPIAHFDKRAGRLILSQDSNLPLESQVPLRPQPYVNYMVHNLAGMPNLEPPPPAAAETLISGEATPQANTKLDPAEDPDEETPLLPRPHQDTQQEENSGKVTPQVTALETATPEMTGESSISSGQDDPQHGGKQAETYLTMWLDFWCCCFGPRDDSGER